MHRVEVIICPTCKGSGAYEHRHYTSYHKGEYDVTHSACPLCKGSGRLKQTTVTKTEPFVPFALKEPHDPTAPDRR
jgi:DnaJ-class molecular chaperone